MANEKAFRARNSAEALKNDTELTYWRDSTGNWFLHFPKSGVQQLTPTYTVTEHDDGTISVSPNVAVVQQKNNGGSPTHSRLGRFVRGRWQD